MKSRVAVAPITGYFYQFDFTILTLLKLDCDSDIVQVEGIEDLDINTATESIAIQCKYNSGKEYNHSLISEPIRQMLKHYLTSKSSGTPAFNYLLYGHYNSGQEKLPDTISVDFLKKHFLTFKRETVQYIFHEELKISNEDLIDFTLRLKININAPSYTSQIDEIFQLIKNQFHCSDFQVENYYYNNALNEIRKLAIQKNVADRNISKGDFLTSIDNKELLYNEWFLLFQGKKQFLKELRKEYFTVLNVSPFERFFLIDIDQSKYLRTDLKELILTISKKWSNVSNRSKIKYCPYIYISNIEPSEFDALKLEMYSEGHLFIDGYPYKGALFNVHSIILEPNEDNRVKFKFVLSLEILNDILSNISRTKEVYQFYVTSNIYQNDNPSIKHIRIQLNELKDIKEVV